MTELSPAASWTGSGQQLIPFGSSHGVGTANLPAQSEVIRPIKPTVRGDSAH